MPVIIGLSLVLLLWILSMFGVNALLYAVPIPWEAMNNLIVTVIQYPIAMLRFAALVCLENHFQYMAVTLVSAWILVVCVKIVQRIKTLISAN